MICVLFTHSLRPVTEFAVVYIFSGMFTRFCFEFDGLKKRKKKHLKTRTHILVLIRVSVCKRVSHKF